MNQEIIREEINGVTYKVYFDDENIFNYIEFDDEKLKQEYLSKFESGELSSYYIECLKECKCCHQLEVIDSLGGMHATSPEEALKDYLENYGA